MIFQEIYYSGFLQNVGHGREILFKKHASAQLQVHLRPQGPHKGRVKRQILRRWTLARFRLRRQDHSHLEYGTFFGTKKCVSNRHLSEKCDEKFCFSRN